MSINAAAESWFGGIKVELVPPDWGVQDPSWPPLRQSVPAAPPRWSTKPVDDR